MTLFQHDQGANSDLNILYDDTLLEQVICFVYLGVEICSNGKIHTSESSIIMKARKGQFKLAHTGSSLPLETVLWVYQRLIDPILTHGYEVWGPLGAGSKFKEYGIYECYRDGGRAELTGEKDRRNFL